MRHHKKFTLDNGDKIMVEVSLYMETGSQPHYAVNLWRCPKYKRKFTEIKFDYYEYRKLSMPDREKHRLAHFDEVIGKDRIHEAKTELWQKLQPQL